MPLDNFDWKPWEEEQIPVSVWVNNLNRKATTSSFQLEDSRPDNTGYPTDVTSRLADKYNTIYFSGAQSQVFIGDYMLDEAVEIEGQYSQDKAPIYSYASRHFNAVGEGRVIVSGSLIINFRYDGYLYAHINSLMEKGQKSKDEIESLIKNGMKVLPPVGVINPNNITTNQPTIPSQNIDAEISSITDGLQGTPTYEEILQFQNTYWNETKPKSFLNAPARPEFAGPFNIKVKDYKVGTGPAKDAHPQEREIIDCYIVRNGWVRRIDGSPLVEVYQWIAKSII